MDRLLEPSPQSLSHRMARYQALRPSLHDLRDLLFEIIIPVLPSVGDEDFTCFETNLMLKSTIYAAQCGSLDCS